jgi:hypothetical protein
MKSSVAFTLLFTTLALATAAPAAHPEAAPAPFSDAPSLAPEIDARAAGLILKSRGDKKHKIKGGHGSGNEQEEQNNTDSSAASMTSNRVLQLGALGLGVMLWG